MHSTAIPAHARIVMRGIILRVTVGGIGRSARSGGPFGRTMWPSGHGERFDWTPADS